MSLATNLSDLATRIATEVKSLRVLINGNAADLSALTTTAKTNLVAAVNEVAASVGEGAGIDDGTTSTTSTWSSDKISSELDDKADLVAGKVPSSQLPSYVDDVLEFANQAAFPGTGETDKIYVALDVNKIYRWSGSAYVEISASPGTTDSLTEGSTNKYYHLATAQTDLVGDTIADAVTNKAPSQNAVFDALATKQGLDATLTALAGLATGANKLPYSTGTDTFSQADLTAAGRALLDDADAAAQCVTLGVGDTATNFVTTFEAGLT